LNRNPPYLSLLGNVNHWHLATFFFLWSIYKRFKKILLFSGNVIKLLSRWSLKCTHCLEDVYDGLFLILGTQMIYLEPPFHLNLVSCLLLLFWSLQPTSPPTPAPRATLPLHLLCSTPRLGVHLRLGVRGDCHPRPLSQWLPTARMEWRGRQQELDQFLHQPLRLSATLALHTCKRNKVNLSCF
jgi:hypothetical protein